MSREDTGGPAFPATEEHGCNSGWSGMDLRDYFAAKAMQAHIAANWTILNKACGTNSDGVNPLLAKISYEAADAMLEARK